MTTWLTWLLGRLPLGWLQLTHNRGRLIAALTGVAFANVLVFVQLGFMGALNETTTRIYAKLDADVVVSSDDFKTLADSSFVPRERLLRASTVPGVASASPLYQGTMSWTQDSGTVLMFTVYGIDPGQRNLLGLQSARPRLRLLDTAAMDSGTRNLTADQAAAATSGTLRFELGGRTMTMVDTFELGSGFQQDGNLVVSDQTFFRLFPTRSAAAPNHVLLQVDPAYSPTQVARAVQAVFASSDRTLARTLADTRSADMTYQNTKRPTGVIFGFGVIIGVLVGIVIVYQVLATDVADHLAEYATLKAIGYRHRYFLGVVFEESVILAVLGFIPGLLSSLALYRIMSAATGLPVQMNLGRVLMVFVGTLLMCSLSGAIATRRLQGADPADLF